MPLADMGKVLEEVVAGTPRTLARCELAAIAWALGNRQGPKGTLLFKRQLWAM